MDEGVRVNEFGTCQVFRIECVNDRLLEIRYPYNS